MIWCESILQTVQYKDITAYLSCPLKFHQFEIHRYVCLILNMERKLLQFMFRKVEIMVRHACIIVSEHWWWAHREDCVIQECLSLQGLSEISLTVTIQIPILLFHVMLLINRNTLTRWSLIPWLRHETVKHVNTSLSVVTAAAGDSCRISLPLPRCSQAKAANVGLWLPSACCSLADPSPALLPESSQEHEEQRRC